MTCHLAMQGNGGTAVMFSDSQGSTLTSEVHGVPKQFAGRDFLVGGAGSIDIIDALFEQLSHDFLGVDSSSIDSYIINFVNVNLTQAARSSVGFLIVTPSSLFEFAPGTYQGFRKRRAYASIGSGSEFVHRAISRDAKTGVICSLGATVSQVLCEVENYLDASNESLTVDDKFLVGIIHGNKSYLMGDQTIEPRYANSKIIQEWPEISKQYSEIMALVRTLRSEVSQAHRVVSHIKYSLLNVEAYRQIAASNNSIFANQKQLENRLDSLMRLYDTLLGR